MNVKKKRPAFGRFMTVLAAVLLMMTGAWAAASDAYAQDDDVTLKGPWTDQDGYVTYDCIWFGNYKQGTDAEKSPIKWRVLKVDGDDVFLSADKVLDVRRYHDYEDERYAGTITPCCEDVIWEDSTLRAWLNGDSSKYSEFADENFMDSAFTADERGAIKNTELYSRGWFDNYSCTTTDRVFILSREEVKISEYGFINKEKRMILPGREESRNTPTVAGHRAKVGSVTPSLMKKRQRNGSTGSETEGQVRMRLCVSMRGIIV